MAKICVLAGYAPSLINFRGPLLAAMGHSGHDVCASAPEEDHQVVDALATLGVDYFQVPMSRAGIDPGGDLLYFFRLWKAFRRRRPDMVLAYTIKPVTFGLLAARFAGVKRRVALVTGLGYVFMDGALLRKRVIRWIACHLYRWALQGSEQIFFQNPDDQEEFARLGILAPDARVCLVNGSGVDLARYREAPVADGPTFLMIARLLRDKGVVEYVQAAILVKARYPEARFILVGGLDPNPAAISNEEIEAWVAAGAIEYWGELSDVRPALASCSVYVLPSYREGTPRTVLEAMAVGRAIITTDAPGCRETVEQGGNGFLVPVRNADSLAEAMFRLIETPELVCAMARRSREIAKEKYDVKKVNAMMLKAMGLA